MAQQKSQNDMIYNIFFKELQKIEKNNNEILKQI